MKDGANVQDDVLKVWVGGEDTLPQLFWWFITDIGREIKTLLIFLTIIIKVLEIFNYFYTDVVFVFIIAKRLRKAGASE